MENPETPNNEQQPDAPASEPAPQAPGKKRANMHEGIGVWVDVCACEAEPYWAELADEMGVDLSDYEDEYKPPKKVK